MEKKALRVPGSNQICNLHNTFAMYYGCLETLGLFQLQQEVFVAFH